MKQQYTLNEAAGLIGASKSTVTTYLDKQGISYTKDVNGWVVLNDSHIKLLQLVRKHIKTGSQHAKVKTLLESEIRVHNEQLTSMNNTNIESVKSDNSLVVPDCKPVTVEDLRELFSDVGGQIALIAREAGENELLKSNLQEAKDKIAEITDRNLELEKNNIAKDFRIKELEEKTSTKWWRFKAIKLN